MGDYLEETAKKYGVLISDLKYSEDLRERALLELTVEKHFI